MAGYNTFVAYDCKKRKNILITSSARKARKELQTGIKVEVWSENKHIETVYSKTAKILNKYVGLEKQYIANKQFEAEQRNKRRKHRGL